MLFVVFVSNEKNEIAWTLTLVKQDFLMRPLLNCLGIPLLLVSS